MKFATEKIRATIVKAYISGVANRQQLTEMFDNVQAYIRAMFESTSKKSA